MIAKDYFKRQATTLRKMIRATRNPTLANRLTLMADEFDSRSADGTEDGEPAVRRRDGACGEQNQD